MENWEIQIFHVWTQRVELLLTFRDLESHITESKVLEKNEEKSTWLKNNAKPKGAIELSSVGEHLEHVHDCLTSFEVWTAALDLFKKE